MRHITALNNDWFFKKGFQDDDAASLIDGNYTPVRLPHSVAETPYNYFTSGIYQFESTYKKELALPPLDGRRAFLCFEGVMLYAELFVNGEELGSHAGGYTAFEFDITDSIRPSGKNIITVRVDSRERADIPPYGFAVDYLTYGGIYREVRLELRSDPHIASFKADALVHAEHVCDVETRCELSGALPSGAYLEAELYDGAERLAAAQATESDMLRIGALRGISLWDIDSPKLYTFKLSIKRADELIDNVETRIGFRTADFKPDGFYLNGRKLKLRGLNRHQAFPYVGYAMPKSAQEKDADILKFDLGVHIARSSHYPPSRHFLRRCDEIGLLVCDEIPGWVHIGNDEWQKRALCSVEEMIRSAWHHPSVVLWAVRINESKDNDELYKKTNERAHSLDPTRQTGGVRNFAGSHVFEDVYTYNDFIHDGGAVALSPAKKISKKKMPYLVSEHNGHMFPTKQFDHEAKRCEHALRHARVLDAMYAAESICGAVGWCMADYNTHKDFGSGDMICYHGVLDMFRNEKYAAALYASQRDDHPCMTVASSMNTGEYAGARLSEVYVFTNCDYIKVYKNKMFIKNFYPAASVFKHLPHPPIIVDDLIGEQIADNEAFSKRDAAFVKKAMLQYLRTQRFSLALAARMALIFVRYKMNFSDGSALYSKYVSNWGSESVQYSFEGYKNGQRVCSVVKTPEPVPRLDVYADSLVLHEGDSYDVTRVSVHMIDEYGNRLQYADLVVCVEIEGALELIGPKKFSLQGGCRAFWVKTTGKAGTAQICVRADGLACRRLDFEIFVQPNNCDT